MMLVIVHWDGTRVRDAESLSNIRRVVGNCRTIKVAQSTVLVVNNPTDAIADKVAELDGVQKVIYPVTGAPLAARSSLVGETTITVRNITFGPGSFAVIAGPCAIESRARLHHIARSVRESGAAALRGGAYKPRTTPYAFQGTAKDGLHMLREVGDRTGMPVVTEVIDVATLPAVVENADILQIGTRNAQNFTLLREVGRVPRPVLLKRGFGCTVDEWLSAAEYILNEGNENVILCERGIRTFEGSTRFTLDLSAVALVKRISHLPVVVDPSHSTGNPTLVRPMSLAAAAAGADGLLVDVHNAPEIALCDGKQALTPADFRSLMTELIRLLSALDRELMGSYIHPNSGAA